MKNTIKNCLYKWYGKVEHKDGMKPLDEWFKRYDKVVENNAWLFTLIKHMKNRTKAEELKQKYIGLINETKTNELKQFNINDSLITIEDIKDEEVYNYNQLGENVLIQHLKQSIGNYNGSWFVRRGSDGTHETAWIESMDEETLKKLVKVRKPFNNQPKINLWNIIENNSNMFIYRGVQMFNDEPKKISLFVIPTGTYNETIINKFINIYHRRVRYVEPFNHLLDSIAYTFQHPNSLIHTFHIQVGVGDDGKSLIFKLLKKIMNNFVEVATQAQLTKDMFNGHKNGKRGICLEEMNIDYKDKSLSNFIKTRTTEDESQRSMCKMLCDAKNYGFTIGNTNQADLNGLTNADEATRSRLCVIEYKPTTAEDKLELEAFYNEFTADLTNNIYTFIHYFRNVRDVKDFKPFKRYDSIEKQEYLEKHKPINSVIRWLIDNIKQVGVVKKVKKVEYYAISKSSGNSSYAQYCKYERINKFNVVNWDDELIENKIGEEFRTNQGRFIIINKELFDKQYLKTSMKNEFDEEEDEEFDIEQWINENSDVLDGYRYIMSKYIDKQHKTEIEVWLAKNGWVFYEKLFSRKLRKAGYKIKCNEIEA